MSTKGPQNVLVIGLYVDTYPRNQVLFKALRGVTQPTILNFKNKRFPVASFGWYLFTQGFRYEKIVIIHHADPLAFVLILFKWLVPKPQIAIDVFTSFYDMYVNDRALVKPSSLKAKYYWLQGFLLGRSADVLLFDTSEHSHFFYSTFRVKSNVRRIILPVSLDLSIINKAANDLSVGTYLPEGKYNVLFFGYYIPLQGVEYILNAAKILSDYPNIHFTLIGSGQLRKSMDTLARNLQLTNVTFIGRLTYQELLRQVRLSNVSLGIFGITEKASRVIPNKLLESLACGTIVITGRNPAIERYFKEGQELFLVDRGDSEDLAKGILKAMTQASGERTLMIELAQKALEQNFSLANLKNILRKELFDHAI